MRDAEGAKQTLLPLTDRLTWENGPTSSQREAFNLKCPLNSTQSSVAYR